MSEDIASVSMAVLYDDPASRAEPSKSAVSWAAIFAGAAAGVAVSLILLAVGAGMGLASVSPWANVGASLTTFTVMTAIWLIFVQWVASGLGGYITGRLRTRWAGTHQHEVFFRDTAHGFLTWSVATLIAVVFVSSSALVTVRGAASAVSGAAQTTDQTLKDAFAYDVDSLYRSTRPEEAAMDHARAEAAAILATGALRGSLPAADRAYLVQLVTARTGIAPADAQARIDTVVAREQATRQQAREAADAARSAGAKLAFSTALAMLIGAFIACVAAALGGQQRDEHP
ncbi:MAG: hypothetical protein ACXU82_12920 [Caulobacteraceae bacterium]